MAPRKKKSKPPTKRIGGENYKTENPRLPGYLLIAFGLLALPINFGLIGWEWLKAWPLLLVLLGVSQVVKVALSERSGKII